MLFVAKSFDEMAERVFLDALKQTRFATRSPGRKEAAPQAGGGTVAEPVAELEVAQRRELIRAQRRNCARGGRPALGEESKKTTT